MRVKELIESLSKMDPDLPIVLQVDPEGNGYYKLRGAEETMLDVDGFAVHPDDHAEYGVKKGVVVFP